MMFDVLRNIYLGHYIPFIGFETALVCLFLFWIVLFDKVCSGWQQFLSAAK